MPRLALRVLGRGEVAISVTGHLLIETVSKIQIGSNCEIDSWCSKCYTGDWAAVLETKLIQNYPGYT